jgi:biotin transport system substrate-specific component
LIFRHDGVAPIALMAALTAVGAFIRIPLPHLPITLQISFVCLAGLLLGPWRGAASQIVYLTTGLIGFPVFAKGGGPQYVLEPSFGYLLGFVPAAFAAGMLTQKTPTYSRCVLGVLAALLVDYAIGLPYLAGVMEFVLGAPLTLESALKIGLLPLPKDLVLGLGTAYLGFRVVRVLRPLQHGDTVQD